LKKNNFSESHNSKNISRSQKLLQAKIIYVMSSMRQKILTALGQAVWPTEGTKVVVLKICSKNSAAHTAKTARIISMPLRVPHGLRSLPTIKIPAAEKYCQHFP
jgi:hypothetical protein